MIPFLYPLQSNHNNRDYYNYHLRQHSSIPVSLISSCSSQNSSGSAQSFNSSLTEDQTRIIQLSNPSLKNITCDRTSCHFVNKDTKHTNLFQPYFVTRSVLPTPSSSSSIVGFDAQPTKINRGFTKKINQSYVEQESRQYVNNSTQSTILNCNTPSPLLSNTNDLDRSERYRYPVNLAQSPMMTALSLRGTQTTSNFLSSMTYNNPKLLSGRHSSPLYLMNNTAEWHHKSTKVMQDQIFDLSENRKNVFSTNNPVRSEQYGLSDTHEHCYTLNTNRMLIGSPPSLTCHSALRTSNNRPSNLSCSTNCKNMRACQIHLKESEITQKSTTDVLIEEKSMPNIDLETKVNILRRRLRKPSRLTNNATKTLIKQKKQKNKLAILKFMLKKQIHQRISKDKISQENMEHVAEQNIHMNVSKPLQDSSMSDIMAVNLKLTFNSTQNIDTISLNYYQRHQPNTNKVASTVTSNTTINKLGLLIDAINYIEKYDRNPQFEQEKVE